MTQAAYVILHRKLAFFQTEDVDFYRECNLTGGGVPQICLQ